MREGRLELEKELADRMADYKKNDDKRGKE